MLTESRIRQIIKEVLDEMAYPASFDMEHFRSLPSYTSRVKYCKQKLQRIGSGSSRVVFKVDDKTVIKVAKNNKGVAQNTTECDWYLQRLGLVALSTKIDDEYRFIETQLARKAKISDFKRLTGFDFATIKKFIECSAKWHHGWWNCNVTKEEENRFAEIIEDNDNILYKLNDYIGNYNLSFAFFDLMRPSSWGVVTEEDGSEKLVLVDYGVNDDVMYEFYSKRQ